MKNKRKQANKILQCISLLNPFFTIALHKNFCSVGYQQFVNLEVVFDFY